MFPNWWRPYSPLTWAARAAGLVSRMRAAARKKKPRAPWCVEPLEGRMLMSANLPAVPFWQEQGPGPITHGQVAVGDLAGPSARDDDFVVGAINAIAVDPQNANRLIVGTVNGGIWKTTNALDANPIWTEETDQFATLAITTIVRSPVNGNVLYAGTGSSSSSGIAGAAGGLLKSIDGGESWSRYGEKKFQGLSIQSIVPTAE